MRRNIGNDGVAGGEEEHQLAWRRGVAAKMKYIGSESA